MLQRLIAILRRRRYRPEVTIFTPRWRHDPQALVWRAQRPHSVFRFRRTMARKEDRKPRKDP